MNSATKLIASLVTLFAVCALHAAGSQTTSRVMSILDIETDDPVGYARWIKEYNEVAKARLGIDTYLRVFQTTHDGRPAPSRVRVVTAAPNVAELMKNAQQLEDDPAILKNRRHLDLIRKTGPRVLYQSVRFDGPSVPGAHNYNTLLTLTDEAAYLKAIEQLRAIFDQNGFKDAKLSVYRVLAGRSDHSHRVVISTPNRERLAAFLDFVGTNPQAAEWLTSTAKIRTVVANTTSREITQYGQTDS